MCSTKFNFDWSNSETVQWLTVILYYGLVSLVFTYTRDTAVSVRLLSILHRTTVTPTKTLGDSTKSLVTGCTDNTTTVTTHTATPSDVANQSEPLTGEDLVAVVKTIVDRSVMKLSTLQQSLHLLHHKVDHFDLMEALQVPDIIEIDCKVCVYTLYAKYS